MFFSITLLQSYRYKFILWYRGSDLGTSSLYCARVTAQLQQKLFNFPLQTANSIQLPAICIALTLGKNMKNEIEDL